MTATSILSRIRSWGLRPPFFIAQYGKLPIAPLYNRVFPIPELTQALARSIPKRIWEFGEGIRSTVVLPNMKTTMKLLAASVVLFCSVVANVAHADETDGKMNWTLKNRSKMDCKLVGGMTLNAHGDFVETKHLVCKRGMAQVITATVACGPEGSVTRFDGHKIKVTCAARTYASNK
jgi:hypothetical protein